MTTNRVGLTPEQSANTFTDEQLESLVYGNNPQSNVYRELLAYRKASKKAVADVVTWNKPGEERKCDIRWRRFDVSPGPLFEAPPLQAVTVPDGWIKCSERMPDAHEPIYIFHPDYGVDQGVWYDNQEDAFLWDSDEDRRRNVETVTHWMNMPQLPVAPSC